MTCYYPNNAHVAGLRPTGTKIIKFGLPKSSKHESLLLPCGQCIGCRLDYSQMWAVRAMHEAQIKEDNAFITLTYNDENLPHDGSLIPNHTRQFIKRLRRRMGPLRYLLCGEYGEGVGHRPHYHALIFGQDFKDKEIFAENEGILTYTSEILSDVWNKGFVTTADLTIESAAYVARYNLKKVNASQTSQDKYHAHYERVCETTGEIRQLHKEYAHMSTNPGIARDWYNKYNSDIFPYDTTIHNGKRVKTPRYYENLLRSADPETFEEIKAERRRRAALHAENNTPVRLRVREKVKKASIKNLTRVLHSETPYIYNT